MTEEKNTNEEKFEAVELCPHCDEETNMTEMIAKCEHCGKWIVCCSMCPDDSQCGSCSFTAKCNKKNKAESRLTRIYKKAEKMLKKNPYSNSSANVLFKYISCEGFDFIVEKEWLENYITKNYFEKILFDGIKAGTIAAVLQKKEKGE